MKNHKEILMLKVELRVIVMKKRVKEDTAAKVVNVFNVPSNDLGIA